ncbi:leucine-rich repeat-containing protein [Heterostelium album PN500]|uniref:Leucine-rich repeat-containing protein n=1 Tax=Heterostelium pallidum (strain ATCC 26659 / Pp 5 / PN500) TaxID=670386 RepID=D3BEU8_HETP5|nr:leucine-rich repeat-containing protein [Heterostelium album PN500]EFA80429.1 leucine-rich repeat-containing protein [Heterostelium album PN500]|eukprot:XP_020432549.1 leucine-rich repeat-containing protein [Heterostelium album PN500]
MGKDKQSDQPIEMLEADQLEQMGPIGGLFGEEIAFQGIVSVSDDGTTFKQRILVVGRYKSLIIKKTKYAKTLAKSIHHYDLIEIAEPSITGAGAISSQECIEIKYKDNNSNPGANNNKVADNNSNNPFSSLYIKSPDRKVENIIIKSIVFTTLTISRGFPAELRLRVTLPANRYQPIQFNHDFGADGKGIAEQYVAHSHYFKRKATLDYLRHLETLYLTRYPELDLAQIPGIDPTCSLGFNLFTAIITLRHNTFIRSLKIVNVPHINVISSVAEMMYTNTVISELNISGLLTEQSYAPLGSALQHIGLTSGLQKLILSNNMMSYESVVSLADGLAAFNHSLLHLDISKCDISPRGMALIFQAFERNFAMSLTLETLVFSGNRFQDTGTSAFVSWLCKIRGAHSLKEFRLSGCQLNFGMLAAALRAVEAIEYLDISKNKITLVNARLLATEALSCFRSLRYLDMSECGLFGDSLRTILTSFVANQKLSRHSLTFNLSNNGFAGNSSQVLVDLLGECNFIGGLDLSMNSLNSRQLIDIMNVLAKVSGMIALNIGYNSTPAEDTALVAAIIDFVGRHSQLAKLGLASYRGFGQTLHPLIQSLNNNKSITALDITGNEMNDHGACLLADCLRNNKSIQKLFISGNKFTSIGWQSLASPFIYYRNTSVIKMELPVPSDQIMTSDANTAILNPERRQQLELTFQSIRLHLELNKNRVSAASRFNYLPSVDPPLFVAPPANVPDHLAAAAPPRSSHTSTNGSSLRASGVAETPGKPMLPSIFAKPINTLTHYLPILKDMPDTIGSLTPTRKSNGAPSSWDDDNGWKNKDQDEEGDH